MNDLHVVEAYLRQFRERIPDSDEDKSFRSNLRLLKEQAVAANDQEKAKTIWCFEVTHTIQNRYIEAFSLMKQQYFYSAWCALGAAEVNFSFLERHLNWNPNEKDKYGLTFIQKHIEQFQGVFPYVLFASPGMLILEQECTICGKPVSIRHSCGHVVGEIYNGEMCARKINKVDLLEISLVTNPVQKYSVMFTNNEAGETEDQYNYSNVDYVARRLRNPFDAWDMMWVARKYPISAFKAVKKDDPCPCGSGETFENCCMEKDAIEGKHLDIHFSVPFSPELPAYEEFLIVRGRDLIRPTEGKKLLDSKVIPDYRL